MYTKFLRLGIVLAILMFTVSVPAQAQSTCPANPTIEQGKTALDAKRYQEAISIFSCVIEKAPDNADAYVGRSEAYLVNGDWFLAYGDFESASIYSREKPPYWERIETRATQLVDKNPANPVGHMLHAFMYWYSDQDARALEEENLILIKDPSNVFALTFEGSSRLILGKLGFERDWTRALELAPQNPSILAIIATSHRFAGNADKALPYANRALEAAPEFASGYLVRGRIYLASGDYLKAIDDFNRAVELGLPPSRTVDALNFMGEAYLHLNRPQDTATCLERAEKASPGSPWVSIYFGQTYNLMSYPDQAAKALLNYATRLNGQNIQGSMLNSGKPLTISLDYTGWNEYSLPVELKKGQTVQFEAVNANKYTDTIIILVSPEHIAVAASDNQPGSFELNASIRNFTVPDDGLYTLLVTSTLDSSLGNVEVRFTEVPPS